MIKNDFLYNKNTFIYLSIFIFLSTFYVVKIFVHLFYYILIFIMLYFIFNITKMITLQILTLATNSNNLLLLEVPKH